MALYSTPKIQVVVLDPTILVSEPIIPAKRLKASLVWSMGRSYRSATSKANRSSSTPDSTGSSAEDRSTRTSSPSAVSPRSGGANVSNAATKIVSDLRMEETISMSVELSRSGCLPGEIVPLTVSVNHTKVIRSLNGIIVTLYRIGRVDMHPDIPMGSANETHKVKRENLYPRSRTGLGGLSLTAAGSSQVWRKELSQTFAPLYIDHHTMSAQVKLAVRVPDDAFPSIRNTPGQMISFRYYVEVIVDMHGKMTDPDLNYPSLSVTGVQSQMPNGEPFEPLHSVTTWGNNCIDTTEIREARWSVSCDCDLVVGTTDSAKVRGKRKTQDLDPQYPAGAQEEYPGEQAELNNDDEYKNYRYESDTDYYNSTYSYGAPYHYGRGYESDDYQYQSQRYNPQNAQHCPSVPLPSMPEEGDLSEKERLGRAEARLLPSLPPADEASSALIIDQAPTAPFLPNEGDFDSAEAYRTAIGEHHYDSNYERASDPASHSETLQITEHDYADLCHASNLDLMQAQHGVFPLDDKQELERQLLQARASAPEDSPGSSKVEPSAPHSDIIDDVAGIVPRSREEHQMFSSNGHSAPGGISGLSNSARENLPLYER